MGWMNRVLGRSEPTQQKAMDAAFWDRLDAVVFGGSSESGERVSAQTSLQTSAVLACVRVLADGVAVPPLKVYRSEGENRKTEARDEKIFRLLHRRPNEFQTSLQWRRTMMVHAVLTGNGRSFINWVNGEIRELIPLDPSWVTVEQQPDMSQVYRVTMRDGNHLPLRRADVFDISNLAWNSYKGLPCVQLARDAIGLSIRAERMQSRLFKNGGRPSGILSSDQPLTPDSAKLLKEQWKDKYGEDGSGGTAVLDQGFKFSSMAMTGVEAQHLETRRFQIEEICRFFNVFPQLVMQADKTSTYASAEAFFSAHIRHSINPWLELWEQEIDEFLLDGAGPLEASFDTTQLTKAATKDVAQFLRVAAETGVYTRNELRASQGLPPLPGLDEPLTPANMTRGNEEDDEEQD